MQNESSKKLLNSFGIHHVDVGGDTRFDRVLEISQKQAYDPLIDEFCKGSKVIVAGSSWEKDEELIAGYLKQNEKVKWIIAPHEINETHLQKIEKLLPVKSARYTKADLESVSECKVLIINTIGMLSAIYRYGFAAYIGGGFGAGIHNTLEAVAYGIPVVFGPNHKKFQEAKDILALKAGCAINDFGDFEATLNELISDDILVKNMGTAAKSYVSSMCGGTQKIITELTKNS